MELPDPRNIYKVTEGKSRLPFTNSEGVEITVGDHGKVASYGRNLRYHLVPQVFVAVMNGYLGDQIASLPLLNWLKKSVGVDLRAVVSDNLRFLYTETGVFKDEEVHPMSKPLEITDIHGILTSDGKMKEPHVLYQFSPEDTEVVRSHILDYMCFRWFGCYMPENWRDQPRMPPLPISENLSRILIEKMLDPVELQGAVLIGVSSRTDSKRWKPQRFVELVDWLNSRNIKTIFIGNDDSRVKKPEYTVDPSHNSSIIFDYLPQETVRRLLTNGMNYDFTSILSLKDTISLMQRCLCLISMEGGINHIAMLTDIPAIVGYTLVNPESRLFYRHGVKGWRTYPVFRDDGCKFCLTDFYMSGWVFDQCYTYFFGENGQQRRYECCDIPLEKWVEAFQRMLEENTGGTSGV